MVSGQTVNVWLEKNILAWTKDKPFRMKSGYILPYTIMRYFLVMTADKTQMVVGQQ